jgi:uncharacterized membrane protein YjjP (DUF1212 family)
LSTHRINPTDHKISISNDPNGENQSPLNRAELRDIIDLALWAGQMLLHYGAESQRVEETVHRLGTGLGCDWMDILVSPNVIVATTTSGIEFRTKVRRVVNFAVDMSVVAAVNDLSHRVREGELDRFGVRKELERIDKMPPQYNRWLVAAMVGLACGAFSRLFEGDGGVFLVTFVAASIAMLVRQELTQHRFNTFLVVFATAFVAGLIGSLGTIWKLGQEPQLALVASVLLLVPGVSLINAAEDIIKGHMVTGIVRAIHGGLISLCIAMGLLMAMGIMGIDGF